ncbi:hypothetical protein CMV_006347 [Castanea mollissima]|uniref:Uncharacterized protein n=1 Tax=Castanea mollissima TaxID=60419 RepID=A0A8J4RR20_9ROSI|nr:hypothetical protein CMV_006347 [Castanea mollissima]
MPIIPRMGGNLVSSPIRPKYHDNEPHGHTATTQTYPFSAKKKKLWSETYNEPQQQNEKQRELREGKAKRERKKKLGLLTRLGQSIVRNHPVYQKLSGQRLRDYSHIPL